MSGESDKIKVTRLVASFCCNMPSAEKMDLYD